MRLLDRVGLQEHDVVRVDEAADQQPGLIKLRRLALKPVGGFKCGGVQLRTLQGAPNEPFHCREADLIGHLHMGVPLIHAKDQKVRPSIPRHAHLSVR